MGSACRGWNRRHRVDVQPAMPAQRELRFAALFDAHFDALLAYARRRSAQLGDAEDVVAETFMTAWRRLDDLPDRADGERPWLYGVARRVLANQRRSATRRARLVERLRSALAPVRLPAPDDVAAAVSLLSGADQEILRLAAWEQLSHREIAISLGISPNAAAIRLHRARGRLKHLMKGSGTSRTSPEWKGSVSSVREENR